MCFCSRPSAITIKWRIIFCHLLLICWKCEIHRSFLCLLMQIYFFKPSIYHRGMREMVNVVLWYIYNCQSVTSWDSDKINSWDVASYHHAVSRSTYSSHASHPILFDISQANTSCQSALKSNSHIYRKVTVIREQRPTTQVNYTTAVQKSHANLVSKFWGVSLTSVTIIYWDKWFFYAQVTPESDSCFCCYSETWIKMTLLSTKETYRLYSNCRFSHKYFDPSNFPSASFVYEPYNMFSLLEQIRTSKMKWQMK